MPLLSHSHPTATPWCSLWSMIERPQRSVHDMLPKEQVPHVDVFICTYPGVCIVRVIGQALLLLVPGTSPAYQLAASLRRGAAAAVSDPVGSSLAVLTVSSALLCRAARDRECSENSVGCLGMMMMCQQHAGRGTRLLGRMWRADRLQLQSPAHPPLYPLPPTHWIAHTGGAHSHCRAQHELARQQAHGPRARRWQAPRDGAARAPPGGPVPLHAGGWGAQRGTACQCLHVRSCWCC